MLCLQVSRRMPCSCMGRVAVTEGRQAALFSMEALSDALRMFSPRHRDCPSICATKLFSTPSNMSTVKQDAEKAQHVSELTVSSRSTSQVDLKSVHRKIDKRLLCWYAFVFMIMRIHVFNISNTAIMNLEQGTGIKKQLGNLSSSQWAWALSIFWYPYMFLEPLATLMLKHFGPNIWMSRIMFTWGIISMCQGATQNYAGILVCRFFLGVAEAGFFPGGM
jgi:hypothetical protein